MVSYVISAGILLFWLAVVPVFMGLPFAEALRSTGASDVQARDLRKNDVWANVRTSLLCGYISLWAVFQVVAVGFILTTGKFDHVVYTFTGLSLAGVVAVLFWKFFKKKEKLTWEKRDWKPNGLQGAERVEKYMEIGIWIAFFLVVLFQLVMSGCMAFADGDDAYYIPISGTSAASGSMYRTIPYTGETTILDVRHGLAPFPIWIAFLSRVSNVPATILAHSILGGVLLLVCYGIYHAVAEELFRDKKAGIPYFMLFVSLLFLFGNYSFYSAETFLMTRTSQGKAVLANLIIPFLFWCLLQLAKQGKKRNVLYFLLLLGSMASWLCSTLGTFLSASLFGIAGFVIAIREKDWKVFAKLMLCALPSMAFALFYYFLQ